MSLPPVPRQWVCRQCDLPTTDGPICDGCSARRTGFRPGARPKTYDDPRWSRLSKRLRRNHVAQFGWWCPGWGKRPGHRSRDLTVDHIVPLVEGGAQLDPANLRILCRGCNGAAGLVTLNRRRCRRPLGVI